ncbi:DUF992 domain-containing protein [Chelativorans sp. ZYF759]|uniref:DUF992 domain-containing protein n=1 Tax=Chelativorans sp. ZYF759 TaxID=2692213 RepID=UPI00145CF564|nr:DUF992 domain-containing protein [Chelativorans sp. ZYF759]NMG39187.1 DUF992 domain-containing protein [Chelativorans sp. ZYF759]
MTRTALLATAATLLAIGSASAQDQTEIGLLECVVEANVGQILSSSREVGCTFLPADESRAPEAYIGVINRYGLDIGVTDEAIMQWLVLAPTTDPYIPGGLAGDYFGASAEATAGIGGGANLLVGGSHETVALQPLSVQAQTGFNIALGVSEFQLRSAQ